MAVLAVDLGGTRAAFAVVEREGRILARAKHPSQSGGRAVPFHVLARAAGDTLAAAGVRWADVEGVGLILPGRYDPWSGHAWAPSLWGDEVVPLRDRLAPLLPARLTADSDRSGYLLGEAWLGAARDCTDAVFLGVGTGMGAGILCGGRVGRGGGGVAGAVGWFVTDPGWTPH